MNNLEINNLEINNLEINNDFIAEIKFNREPIKTSELDNLPFDTDKTFFGIIDIHVKESPITTTMQVINIAIDASSSMSESCNDGKEKIDHIKHTVKNILNYILSKPQIKVLLNVFIFSSSVTDILINETVTEDNINELKKKIDKIYADGGTNIENALKKFIELSKNISPDYVVSNIFMSDGYATEGVTNIKLLGGLVNESVSNTFIGFGIEHNPKLLTFLSSSITSTYYYIDVLENSGHVYGEILHGILYKKYQNTILTVENGLIYNWKTNSWSSSLMIGNLVSDTYKQFHIISKCCDEVSCAFKFSEEEQEKNVYFMNSYDDLSKFYFRQKTLQILFNSHKLNDELDENEHFVNLKKLRFDFNEEEEEEREKKRNDKLNDQKKQNQKKVYNIKLLKKQMTELIKNMEEYKINNNMTEDKFIKNLCLDIAICYKTIGTDLGNLYSYSRQISQGSQRIHSVKTPRKNNYNLTPLNSNSNSNSNPFFDDDSIFSQLQSPRRNKHYKVESFDSFDHLLNDFENEDSDTDNNNDYDQIINKYIDDEADDDNNLDSPYYCSESLINTILTVSDVTNEN
jgi:hypothetical protein